MTLYVTGIRKRGGHYNPHERIQGLCGTGWYKTEEQVIAEIESKTNDFYVRVGAYTVKVIVATHLGRKYVKTEKDGISPDNLLSLPECS